MQPVTHILGATLKRGNPKPVYYAKYFKSMGTRNAFFRGEITDMQAYHKVPVYAGMSASLVRTLKAHFKYAKKQAAK